MSDFFIKSSHIKRTGSVPNLPDFNDEKLIKGENYISFPQKKDFIVSDILKKVEENIIFPIKPPKIHELHKVSIKELITIDNEGVLKILSNDYFKDINLKDLERALLEKIDEIETRKGIKVKTIDISEFNNEKYKFLKERLYNIIGNNFPLLEVSRLSEGAKVLDITFLGIKTLNDNLSKDFVDLFNNKLKKYFQKNFIKNTGLDKKHGRIIRDNYKHITFSMNTESDISETIFGNIKSKTELLEMIFNSLDERDLRETLKESKVKSIRKVKHLLLKEFDFGIGSTILEKRKESGNITLNDKLEAFYKAEIASRNKVDLSNLGENLEFNFDNIKFFAENALKKEKEIISKYKGKKFIFNSTSFDIVVNGKLNNILLRCVRKGENIGDAYLDKLVADFIDNLTNGFDFIAPFVEQSQLNDIGKIEKQLESGVIETKLLNETYKNTLSIEALKIQSKGKEGLRVFVDIVDMGIMNLNDFRNLAGKVVSGELHEENISELLLAGQTATNRFQNLVFSLKDSFPESKISLGGDEIFIFIPGKIELESKQIISNITSKLYNENLVGRISSSTNKNNDRVFDSLDTFTSINKVFEKKVEKIINNNNNVKVKKIGPLNNIKTLKDIKSFTSINLDIEGSIQKLIFENTSDFIVDLQGHLKYNMVKEILTGKKDIYTFSFDILKRDNDGGVIGRISNFYILISKTDNNELIISIK